MFKKIKRIRNLGIFKDYSWDAELQGFNRYNLIYGLNGSGKTTLTNLFAAIEKGASEKYRDLEYQIETESGHIRQGEAFSKKIRVFNEDYISNNVQLLQGKTKPIFILGEENKKIAEEIEIDTKLLSKKTEKLQQIATQKESQETQKDNKFTNIARIISSIESGQATRSYTKRNAEEAFQELFAKELLELADIQKHQLTLRQLEMHHVTKLTIPTLKYQDEEEESDLDCFLEKVVIEGKNLFTQTIESITIDRLKENSDIAKWVEEGIKLHERHKSTTCEYCGEAIPDKRKIDLVNHFNEADRRLKNSLDTLIGELRKAHSLVEGIMPVDKANLYGEFQSKYQSATLTYENEKTSILEKINNFIKALDEKKSKTTESVTLESTIDVGPFLAAVDEVNIEIEKHNAKTNDFKNQKTTAREKLEKHHLNTIYDEVKDSTAKIASYASEMEKIKNGDPDKPDELGISDLDTRITENKAKISSSHKACKALNENLKTFLGRDEIVFEVEEEGYAIKRNGTIAYNLSKGEQNAIAFVYFMVHLQDQDFDVKNGVVIVDDPVSSLDSDSLFQAFSFLKNAVKDAHQVFLFTHNFDFLRLLLNWFQYIGDTSYYMLKNRYIDGDRSVEISKLDQLLKNYQSEYHYLFKTLYEFTSDGSIESVYHVPNLARKVLDTFLMFRVPNGHSTYAKLKELDFDESKKTAIYQFTNVQSHITGKGFDPSLVPETQKNVKYLLEMIEEVFPQHYKILVKSISN